MAKKNTGLFCDDRLKFLRNMNARRADKMRTIIIKIFKEVGYQLEIKTNFKKFRRVLGRYAQFDNRFIYAL